MAPRIPVKLAAPSKQSKRSLYSPSLESASMRAICANHRFGYDWVLESTTSHPARSHTPFGFTVQQSVSKSSYPPISKSHLSAHLPSPQCRPYELGIIYIRSSFLLFIPYLGLKVDAASKSSIQLNLQLILLLLNLLHFRLENLDFLFYLCG